MPGRDIHVIGASAGGVEALAQLAQGLPADLPAALFVVLHLPPHGLSVLPQILSRSGPLPAAHAHDGEPIRHGRIYVAPPDYHLLLHHGAVRVVRGPRENGHRPAVDPLFRTAAKVYGARVVGVVLSGALDDGTAGLAAVRQRGGVAVVQDPDDARYDSMPRSALENVGADHCLALADVAPTLVRLSGEVVEEALPPADPDLKAEADIAELDPAALNASEHPGEPSAFACPDCGGVLWELQDGDLLRFRCRVGHAWTAGTLVGRQSDAVEDALWTALRALEEKAAMARRLAGRARKRDAAGRASAYFERQAAEVLEQAGLLRRTLLQRNADAPVAG